MAYTQSIARPRLRDLLTVVPLGLLGVGALITGVYVIAGFFLLTAVAVFWWLTTHQGPATATKEEQAEERLSMSHPDGGIGGGGAY